MTFQESLPSSVESHHKTKLQRLAGRIETISVTQRVCRKRLFLLNVPVRFRLQGGRGSRPQKSPLRYGRWGRISPSDVNRVWDDNYSRDRLGCTVTCPSAVPNIV